jgi:hypothetical protein
MPANAVLSTGEHISAGRNPWSGAVTLTVNGQAVQGTKSGGMFSPKWDYVLPSGATLTLKQSGLSGLSGTLNGQPVQIGRKLTGADYALGALPLLLPILTLGGGLYIGLGIAGFVLNLQTLSGAESTRSGLRNVLVMSLAIIVIGILLAVLLGVALGLARR